MNERLDVKSRIKIMQYSDNTLTRLIYIIFKKIYHLITNTIKYCVNPDYRSIVSSKILRSRSLHQTTTITFSNRYPEVFLASLQNFPENARIKILSYGCSTGEEVESLRQYYPDAKIIGADINKNCLKICRTKKMDEETKFVFSSQEELMNHGPYDAIFCMAVFQREPHKVADLKLQNISRLYPFKKFEEQIIDLDKLLNVGGLLVIHFTQYVFEQTSIASRYEIFGDVTQKKYGLSVFDKSGDTLDSSVIPNSIYKKIR